MLSGAKPPTADVGRVEGGWREEEEGGWKVMEVQIRKSRVNLEDQDINPQCRGTKLVQFKVYGKGH